MCDTMVVLPGSTADGSVLFAKNSDREPNEAHHLQKVPAAQHAEGEMLQCTYIQIPQARETHGVLLAKPFWIWGAEMGANDAGVVIGNEAVFTKLAYDKSPGLIGMDFLRLGLERAASAEAALHVITGLLETYGQGGSCQRAHPFYYHNSFLIADPREAWILETADKQWAARRVKDFGSISNRITIEQDWDLASADLVNLAIERGWCRSKEQFSFARCYSDLIYTQMSDAASRQHCTMDAMRSGKGKTTAASMMNTLRSHRGGGANWSPGGAVFGADVCMHAAWGPVRGSQSTGSMVSRLTPESQTHWFSATSGPCTSIFKPVWMDAELPDTGPTPNQEFDEGSLWWRHELLHRETLRDYPRRMQVYAGERDELEARFASEEASCRGMDRHERGEFSRRCFEEAAQAENEWLGQVRATPSQPSWQPHYAQAWKQFNREARIPVSKM